jgi:hypothetical protein
MHSFTKFVRFCVPIAFVAIAGCGGSSGAPTATTAVEPAILNNAHARAWMSARGVRSNLLYVSDTISSAIFVYTYPGLKLAGYLPTGSEPAALCVDKAQNVWVTLSSNVLLEYAHGATSPFASLGSPKIDPLNCAVDPRSGDLAVSGYGDNGGPQLEVYRNARGKPTLLSPTNGAAACTYDHAGNLYVDGYTEQANLTIAMLPRGSSKFQYFQTSTLMKFPGNVQWDGKYLAVGDQATNTIYRFDVAASGATEIGSLTLDQSTGIGQFYIYRKRIIAPTSLLETENGGTLSIYNYPAGGTRIRTLRNMSLPVGAVISLGEQ